MALPKLHSRVNTASRKRTFIKKVHPAYIKITKVCPSSDYQSKETEQPKNNLYKPLTVVSIYKTITTPSTTPTTPTQTLTPNPTVPPISPVGVAEGKA